MQMSENNRFFSFALDSAHEKVDVWTGPACLVNIGWKSKEKKRFDFFIIAPLYHLNVPKNIKDVEFSNNFWKMLSTFPKR